jgi:DNA invertase Pin-like site-specific DNA recombinase
MGKRQPKNKKSETPGLIRVVAYIRVSTEQQAESGSSLEQQRARLEVYCQAFGYQLVAVETDAGLSEKLAREAWSEGGAGVP